MRQEILIQSSAIEPTLTKWQVRLKVKDWKAKPIQRLLKIATCMFVLDIFLWSAKRTGNAVEIVAVRGVVAIDKRPWKLDTNF